ncbi:RhuM family protein [Cellulophaga baltica]|uniref:RhuM family protein n=1 Tax=Cellulophaga baltica TaxID=76594 RepID=UPI001D040E14
MFKTEELLENSVVAKYATTAADGKIYNVEYYKLDAILSVGYRVNSKRGTKFRIWATSILKYFLNQGDITLNFFIIYKLFAILRETAELRRDSL